MEILDCPLLSVNVRIWRFWSFVMVHNWRRYVIIISVSLQNVFLFTDLYRVWGNIQEVIINAYFAVLHFNAVTRAVILVYNRQKYETFLAGAAQVYGEICSIDDEAVAKLVTTYTRRGRLLSVFNLALGAVISSCFIVYPLFTGQRALPYGMYIPGVDSFASPQYEIIYITQVVLTFPACCMYIPYTSFFATSTLFGLVQIKTLQHQLRTFRTGNLGGQTPTLNRKLKKFIEDHKRIIRYVNDLNDLVTYICLIEFLSFGLMLCALLFLLNIINVMAQIVIVMAYIFMILTQIFAFYWHSNEVREESMGIAEAAYSGPWVGVDDSVKKELLLITLRAQRPLELTVGNVYPMTLEMFQSLLNASYSYFTLLRRVYN